MEKIYSKLFCLIMLFLMVAPTLDAQTLVAHRRNIETDVPSMDWTIKAQVAQFGLEVAPGFTNETAWATDGLTEPTDADSSSVTGQYCCEAISNASEVAGKVAFISRGACEFGVKLLNAEEAGATAGIVANRAPIGRDIGTHTSGMIWMAPGAVGDSVTIAGDFISWEDRRAIANVLNTGPVELTYTQNYMYDAAIAYAKTTPIEQVTELEDITLVVTNLDTVIWTDVTLTCEVTSPSGAVTMLTESVDTLFNAQAVCDMLGGNCSGEQGFTFDETYMPTEVGTYTAVFTTDVGDPDHPIAAESITMTFDVTEDKTYALDNGNVVNTFGMGMEFQAYIDNGGQAGVGSIYRTAEATTATGVTFGLANPQALFPGDVVIAKVYRADGDGDGTLDSDASGTVDILDFPPSQVITAAQYEITGNESPNELLTIEFDVPADIDGGTLYLVTVETPGFAVNQSPNPPAWTTAGGMNFPNFGSIYRFGNDNEGTFEVDGWEEWNDVATVLPGFPHGGPHPVVRLHTEGFVFTSTEELLSNDKFTVNPTLANDYVQLQLTLANASDVVKVQITDLSGRIVKSLVEKNVQNATYEFDTSSYPAGNYFLTLETREGTNTQKFVVAK